MTGGRLGVSRASTEMSLELQERAWRWALELLGETACRNIEERTLRFLEEAIELAQATGLRKERVERLVEYVYARPRGELAQEVGGVMVTLWVLGRALGIDVAPSAEAELERCRRPDVSKKIRRRQAEKRKALIAAEGPVQRYRRQVDALNAAVTGAIMDAEAHPQGSSEWRTGHRRVAGAEEAIAERESGASVEGIIARLGAVHAWLNAGEPERALTLAKRYETEIAESERVARKRLREMAEIAERLVK